MGDLRRAWCGRARAARRLRTCTLAAVALSSIALVGGARLASAQDSTGSAGAPTGDAAAPDATRAAAAAEEAPGDSHARAPKVAVVVAGDPDPGLRAAARRAEDALAQSDRIALASDARLRDALRGEPGADDDGLAGARAERRALGLGDARDRPHLATLATLAGAVAVAVVRARPDGQSELVVADVGRGALFEGELELSGASPEAIARFVGARARAAARASVAAVARPPRPGARTAGPAGATAGAAPSDDRTWLERNWALLAAGAGLVALVVVVLLTRGGGTDTTPGPVLRFVPGDRP